LEDFPNIGRWFRQMEARPAVIRALDKAKEINPGPAVTATANPILFGQTAASGRQSGV
jgi:hypothetical protein